MRKVDRKKLILHRETLRPLEDLKAVAAAQSEIIECLPHTQRICPITTTL